MNKKNLMIISILSLTLVILLICYIIYNRFVINKIDTVILNSVYAKDDYFIYYVPLVDICDALVKIANSNPKHLKVLNNNKYKIRVENKNNLRYISCELLSNDRILASAEFNYNYIDQNNYIIRQMLKKVKKDVANIGYLKKP